jgi:hypothetical protein
MADIGAALSGLGTGLSGFTQGLQGALNAVQQRQALEAQAEHLAQQTKLLKAQQTIMESQHEALGRLGQAMVGQQGQPPDMSQILPLAMQAKVLPPEAMTTALGLSKNVTHVDMGDKIGVFQNGQLTGFMPKGPAPMNAWQQMMFGGGGQPQSAPAAPMPMPGSPLLSPEQVGQAQGESPAPQPSSGMTTPSLPPGVKIGVRGPMFDPAAAVKQQADAAAGPMIQQANSALMGAKPDYDGALSILSKAPPTPQVMALTGQIHTAKAASSRNDAKPNPLEARNIPDNVLYGIAQGAMPPIALADGTRLDQAGAQAIVKKKMEVQAAQGTNRMLALGKVRTVNMLDTANGNRPVTITVDELKSAPSDRYISAGGGEKALNKTALIEDIRGAINTTRESLAALKVEFTPTQAAQLSVALGGPRAGQSALDAIFASSVGKTLTPEQVDYVTSLAQLKENAMAMRSVIGAGQGSDELRQAISATIPSPRTPTRDYATKALDKFEAQIDRLARGVPEVPLRGATQAPPQSSKNPTKPFSSMTNQELLQHLQGK